MRLHDQLRLSFHNLMLHKVRSLLTSLGVIFGVGSVIAMLSISEGAKRQALSQIESMGVDRIIVCSVKPSPEGKDVSSQTSLSVISNYGLTEADLSHIEKMDNVASVSFGHNTKKSVVKGSKKLDISLAGVSFDFLDACKSGVVQGRWLSPSEAKSLFPSCVIGRNVKRRLFRLGEQRILGANIRIEDAVFRVVGVIENNLGTQISGIGSPNDTIFISLGVSDMLFGRNSYERIGRGHSVNIVPYDVFIVKVSDVAYIDHTAKRIASYLDKTHASEKDWGMVVPLDLLKQREATQDIFTIVMGSIAGISLLVGGVGIMNIMLANVYERRKEIGTRRTLGAMKSDILTQFLLETVFLTSMGGGIGVGLGLFLSDMVGKYAGWPIAFSAWFIFLALGISAATGIMFGTYPAWKAAQQSPIEVLRSE